MSKRLLIIDDEPDVLHIVATVLESKGYEVKTAHDGQEALDIVERERPDLVICDLIMPVISGMEFIKRIRRNPDLQETPIIVMSGAGRDSGKDENFFRQGLGADDFIMKPFDPLNLLGRVEAVLRMSQYGEEKPAEPAPSAPVSTAKLGGVSIEELPTLDPSGIVKAFIEAPNYAAYNVEFRCLGGPLTGGLDEDGYIKRREESHVPERRQRMLKVLEMTGDETKAKVKVEREDQEGRFPKKRREEYDLEKGANNWQIVMVRPA